MMKVLVFTGLTVLCCIGLSEGIWNPETAQKSWAKIQDNLPEPWSLIFQQKSTKQQQSPVPSSSNETERDLCSVCQNVVPTVKLIAAFIPNFEAIRDTVYEFCKILLNQLNDGVDADTLCLAIDSQGPHVLSIIKNRAATVDKICRNMNLCIDPAPEGMLKRSVIGNEEKNVKQLRLKAKKNRSKAKKNRAKVAKRSGVIRIGQVADIHVDPNYAIGSPTDCGLVVCCREHYKGNGSAGSYGTYQCNTPQRTLDLFLQKVKDLDPAFVVYTGDNPNHHVWEEHRDENILCSDIAYESLGRVLEGTKVYCAIGNHEAYPTNLFYPRDEMTQDLMRRFVDWWSPLGELGEEQRNTILKGAVYTIPTQIPGLRILSVNTCYWYIFNFYNILMEDSEEEIYVKQFVEESLANARAAGEKVLMLLHHPQGDPDSIVNHARWLRQTITDYSDVILFTMSGHTHYDEVKLYRNPVTGIPNSVVHVAPSVTPMTSSGGGVNPSVRIFTMDSETFELLEIEQYQMDLSQVENENPEIKLIYKFTEEYDLPDVSVESMGQFMERIKIDEEYFNKWWKNRNTQGPQDRECTGECRIEQICYLDNVVYDEYLECVREGKKNAKISNKHSPQPQKNEKKLKKSSHFPMESEENAQKLIKTSQIQKKNSQMPKENSEIPKKVIKTSLIQKKNAKLPKENPENPKKLTETSQIQNKNSQLSKENPKHPEKLMKTSQQPKQNSEKHKKLTKPSQIQNKKSQLLKENSENQKKLTKYFHILKEDLPQPKNNDKKLTKGPHMVKKEVNPAIAKYTEKLKDKLRQKLTKKHYDF